MTFYIKRGDTAPPFNRILRDKQGVPINIGSITELSFYLRDEDYNTVVDADTGAGVTVVNGPSGEAEYKWSAGDTDIIGSYKAEFEIEFTNGNIRSIPQDGYYDIEIVEDIND